MAEIGSEEADPELDLSGVGPVRASLLKDEELEAMVYGMRVVIADGTEYYASADEGGSGSKGVIGNRWTPLGMDLYTGGFARLDEDNRVSSHRGCDPQDVLIASGRLVDIGDDLDRVWTGIFLDPNHESLIGWVPIRSVMVCTCEYDEIFTDFLMEIEEKFQTTTYLCQLNNELDQIRAVEMLD